MEINNKNIYFRVRTGQQNEVEPIFKPKHRPEQDKVEEPTYPMVKEQDVISAIKKANKALVQRSTQLEFSIHEKTKEIMVKVLDSETQEVIREIPPEKVLDMVAKLWELAGILVDERR
ncbi:MAG: flagellar protein FlaG [Desulfitobacterium hafniense]|nr:flagellar protein FlaG [Desulfitobacterium hafniense]